jgi:hypothetical protein
MTYTEILILTWALSVSIGTIIIFAIKRKWIVPSAFLFMWIIFIILFESGDSAFIDFSGASLWIFLYLGLPPLLVLLIICLLLYFIPKFSSPKKRIEV